MSKLIIAAALFLISALQSHAQTKIEKFCDVITVPNYPRKPGRTVSIYFGQNTNFLKFKDSTVIKLLLKVNEFNAETDAVNYMIHIGWSLISINWQGNSAHVYFKKDFDISELEDK